jgi:hypothetical protein
VSRKTRKGPGGLPMSNNRNVVDFKTLSSRGPAKAENGVSALSLQDVRRLFREELGEVYETLRMVEGRMDLLQKALQSVTTAAKEPSTRASNMPPSSKKASGTFRGIRLTEEEIRPGTPCIMRVHSPQGDKYAEGIINGKDEIDGAVKYLCVRTTGGKGKRWRKSFKYLSDLFRVPPNWKGSDEDFDDADDID